MQLEQRYVDVVETLNLVSKLLNPPVVQLQQIRKNATIPVRAYPTDAGLDLFACYGEVDKDGNVPKPFRVPPGQHEAVPTGIAIAVPPGYEAQIRPRSGLALKNSITVLNSPGTIDASYRGEVIVLLINHSKGPFEIEYGMKIAQLVINRIELSTVTVVDQLPPSDRGANGFGSSGV